MVRVSQVVPISLQCGEDYWIQFVYMDGNGNPITVTAPRMEVRQRARTGLPDTSGTLLYSSETNPATIVLTQPSANTVLATITGATSKNLLGGVGGYWWDAYATDPNGKTVLLGSGTFQATPNVTEL